MIPIASSPKEAVQSLIEKLAEFKTILYQIEKDPTRGGWPDRGIWEDKLPCLTESLKECVGAIKKWHPQGEWATILEEVEKLRIEYEGYWKEWHRIRLEHDVTISKAPREQLKLQQRVRMRIRHKRNKLRTTVSHIISRLMCMDADAMTIERQQRRGRKVETDLKADAKVFDAWATGSYPKYSDLARESKTTAREVRLAVDRERHRRRKDTD